MTRIISHAQLIVLIGLICFGFAQSFLLQGITRPSVMQRANASISLNNKYKPLRMMSNADSDGATVLSNIDNAVPTSGKVLSSTILVAGTTVGAGILALGTVSQKAGFIPSTVALVGAWIFMTITGLLIAEVACNADQKQGQGNESSDTFGILAMSSKLLGKPGAIASGAIFVFISYSLLVAYIAEAGKLLGDALHLPTVVGPLLFATVIGGSVALGSTSVVEMMNNVFFCIVIASFLSLAGLGIGSMNIGSLGYQNYAELPEIIPIFLVALVYHNVVPSISSELGYHKPSIRTAVALGSFIPLMMFIIWNAVVLGQISDYSVVADAAQGIDPLKLLMSNIPPAIQPLTEALITIFSESAIITSFIGFYIGLLEFYRDIWPNRGKRDPFLISLVLLPPTLIGLLDPTIFLNALDVAGTYGISMLFGALPAVLAWKSRNLFSNEVPRQDQVFSPLPSAASGASNMEEGLSERKDDMGDFDRMPSSVSPRRNAGRSSGGVALLERKTTKVAVQKDAYEEVNSGSATATTSMTSLATATEAEENINISPLVQYQFFVPGGNPTLLSVAAVAFGIIIVKIAFEL